MSQLVIVRMADGQLRLIVFGNEQVEDEFAGSEEYIMRLVKERIGDLKCVRRSYLSSEPASEQPSAASA